MFTRGGVLAALALVVGAAFSSSAGAVTFTKVCGSAVVVPTFCVSARCGNTHPDSIEVRCPGNPVPVMVLWGCVDPRVTRLGTDYTLTCSKWNRYDVKPAAP